jgi:hypothetical protein
LNLAWTEAVADNYLTENTSGKGKGRKNAQEKKINIAFPVFRTGRTGFPVTDACYITLAALVDWFNDLHLGYYREALFERVFCVLIRDRRGIRLLRA